MQAQKLAQRIVVRALLLTLLASLAAVIVICFRERSSDESSLTQRETGVRTGSAASKHFSPLGLDALLSEGYAKMSPSYASRGPEAGDLEKHRQSPVEAVGTLDQILETVLAEDPSLGAFHVLREKVIRTAKEKADYRNLLADKSFLADAFNELESAGGNKELDQSEEVRRLLRVQYINAALDWKENPSRSVALDAVRKILLSRIPSGSTIHSDALGSLLGDRFDLFQHLMISDPDEAQRLLRQAKGTSSERILRLAYESARQYNQH
jgi:hypothetical protein